MKRFSDASLSRRVIAFAFTAVLPFAAGAFPNAVNQPPPGWTGPVFKLSQSYPTQLPTSAKDTAQPWKSFDFKNAAQSKQYLNTVLQYCFEGNLDPANPNESFPDVGANSVRHWYHAPWLEREFIHGLTSERPSRPGELGAAQTHKHDNWAVGFYNPLGGYIIGRVWKTPSTPDPRKAVFVEGTVSCKLIFTRTPVSEAPFLDGSLTWQADVNHAQNNNARPELKLLQVDVAIRDARATPTGWVFGTFEYSKSASNSSNWWDHLVPVGLMWGNDVAHVIAKQPSQEQQINDTRDPQLHLGYRNLLNGPIDNPNASCMGCHGAAQIAVTNSPSPKLPKFNATTPSANASPDQLHAHFDDIAAATALSPSYVSLDYSLQLQTGIANAIKAKQAHLPPGVLANTVVHGSAVTPHNVSSVPHIVR
jgi:hypothetical protein